VLHRVAGTWLEHHRDARTRLWLLGPAIKLQWMVAEGYEMREDAKGLPPSASKLCYLDAQHVTVPHGVLADLAVVTPEGKSIGRIAGVVIETAARRVRYLDVRVPDSWQRRRLFMPADQLGQVDPERKVLRLLTSDVSAVSERNLGQLPQFSDDDLLDVIFSPRAA
jgi:hypothetical protein